MTIGDREGIRLSVCFCRRGSVSDDASNKRKCYRERFQNAQKLFLGHLSARLRRNAWEQHLARRLSKLADHKSLLYAVAGREMRENFQMPE